MFKMFMLNQKLKMYTITAIIIIIVIIAIYIYGRRSVGKKPVVLPQDRPGSPLTQAEQTQAETLARSLHDEMKGLNVWFDRNLTPHQNYSQLSDKMFVAVYNKFNQLFYTEANETLRGWYESEDNLPLIAGSTNFVTLKNAILERMDRLKLT